MSRRKLTINRNSQGLLSVPGRSNAGALSAFQTNEEDFWIQVVDDAETTIGQAAEILDLAAYGLRVVLFLQATGTEGDEAENTMAATYEAGWSWDSGEQAFLGTLDFNTSEIVSFLGENDLASAHLEFNLVKPNGRYETLFQTAISLKANGDVGQSTAPSALTPPATQYYRAITTSGTVTLVANVVTFTGLGLGSVPSGFIPTVDVPVDGGAITACFIRGSATTDAASFILSAIPENDNYWLRIIPLA